MSVDQQAVEVRERIVDLKVMVGLEVVPVLQILLSESTACLRAHLHVVSAPKMVAPHCLWRPPLATKGWSDPSAQCTPRSPEPPSSLLVKEMVAKGYCLCNLALRNMGPSPYALLPGQQDGRAASAGLRLLPLPFMLIQVCGALQGRAAVCRSVAWRDRL